MAVDFELKYAIAGDGYASSQEMEDRTLMRFYLTTSSGAQANTVADLEPLSVLGMANEKWLKPLSSNSVGSLLIGSSEIVRDSVDGCRYVEVSCLVYLHPAIGSSNPSAWDMSSAVAMTFATSNTTQPPLEFKGNISNGNFSLVLIGAAGETTTVSNPLPTMERGGRYYVTVRVKSCSAANVRDGEAHMWVNGVLVHSKEWESNSTTVATLADGDFIRANNQGYLGTGGYYRNLMIWQGWSTDAATAPLNLQVADFAPTAVTGDSLVNVGGSTAIDSITDNDDATYVETEGDGNQITVSRTGGIDPIVNGKVIRAVMTSSKLGRGNIASNTVTLQHKINGSTAGIAPQSHTVNNIAPNYDIVNAISTFPTTGTQKTVGDFALTITNEV